MRFGEKLKLIRSIKKWSQQDLADILGTTKQAISRYENSERDPGLRTLQSFSEKLNIDLLVLSNDTLRMLAPERIKFQREAQGWRRDQLAELIGITEDRLSDLEDGSSFPTAPELVALSEALCCPADYFLGLTWNAEASIPSLTSDELDLILLYRRLNKNNKNSNTQKPSIDEELISRLTANLLSQTEASLVESLRSLRSDNTSIPESELDEELLTLFKELTPEESTRVMDFISGLIAARKDS